MEGNRHELLRDLIESVTNGGPIVETCGMTVATLYPADRTLVEWYETFVTRMKEEEWFKDSPSFVYPSQALHCTVATLVDFIFMHNKPPVDIPFLADLWREAIRNVLASLPDYQNHLVSSPSSSVVSLEGLSPVILRMKRPRMTSNCAILEFEEIQAEGSFSLASFREMIKQAFAGSVEEFYKEHLSDSNHFRIPTIIHSTFLRVFEDMDEARASRFRAGFDAFVEREWPKEGLVLSPVTSFILAHEWTPFMHMFFLDPSRPFSLSTFQLLPSSS